MKLYNSLTKQKEEFVPITGNNVGMYTCGITVYDFAHIGHGRKYVYDDMLRRTLTYLGFEVKHVQNVTDVGHLVSDGDEGEDKLEKGARKFGKTVWEVAEYFTDHFYQSMDSLNILRPNVVSKATEHISEQIELVQALIYKGFAYDTSEAVYFDVAKFPTYGSLFGQKIEDKVVAARAEVETGSHKRNPVDFAVWFKRVDRFADHTMHWSSPWGEGFPGWHIECSAMAIKYLGEQFDIHTGGEDHLPIHHPNEIAQAEAATGKSPFVKYWVHHAFLMVEGAKMSKSLGNIFTIEDVERKGFNPLALRYYYLTAHYKKQQNFTWAGLEGAQTALTKLQHQVAKWQESVGSNTNTDTISDEYQVIFQSALEDDLNLPQALAVVWNLVKDTQVSEESKLATILNFDQVLGLRLDQAIATSAPIPESVMRLAEKRERFKLTKDYQNADKIRDQIQKLGYQVSDTSAGVEVIPTKH